uniref:Solute carrier family 25 member 44 n=1 Tax=Timema cristinae TaxID=61476 RepID=A0A7R9GR96_TIMCR|nr:unnamed protein product [Timema cristinae]
MTTAVESPQFIRTIEWDMMDKSKFFPLSMLSSFSVRCCLYPLTVIKTRLQVQRHDDVYKGGSYSSPMVSLVLTDSSQLTADGFEKFPDQIPEFSYWICGVESMVDAWTKIYQGEGAAGLYRGFWVSTFQIISGAFYISTYEGVRHILTINNVNSRLKSLVAGGCASAVGQTIVVPFDVMSQHLMVLGVVDYGPKKQKLANALVVLSSTAEDGEIEVRISIVLNPLGISMDPTRSRLKITLDIMKQIYIQDGVHGFYRGYVASLCTYVPNSAMWWTFYHLYQDELYAIFPSWVSHLFIQCMAGTLGGFTTTLLTNPLDIVRARLQVQRLDSMQKTFHILWTEERLRIFTKGLSARMVQSACFSFAIILGYETIKRMSVNEE